MRLERGTFALCDRYRIQTYNLLIRSQMLYSVELIGRCISPCFQSDRYRIQTYNLLIRSQMLYSVELIGLIDTIWLSFQKRCKSICFIYSDQNFSEKSADATIHVAGSIGEHAVGRQKKFFLIKRIMKYFFRIIEFIFAFVNTSPLAAHRIVRAANIRVGQPRILTTDNSLIS